ncbi:MAG: deoxyribodipyrimidine photo-lyase [Desulfovibrionales bacterium]
MSPIPSERIHILNDHMVREGAYVLYWMQQSQRADDNHALEYAAQKANDQDRPLLVCFGLLDDYPEANLRHYTFMLEGLKKTGMKLAERRIKLLVRQGNPPDVALELGDKAGLIVCDRGYLRHQRGWRKTVARKAKCRVVEIEADCIVPVETVSDKREYAARTIRKKLHQHLLDFLQCPEPVRLKKSSLTLHETGLALDDIQALCAKLSIDRSVPPVSDFFRGRTSEAHQMFNAFLRSGFSRYEQNSNQPQTDDVSHMSPYLHFGQISPVRLIIEAQRSMSQGDFQSYVEQLLVRRELSFNYVWFEPGYDRFSSLPDWALHTLDSHKEDKRPARYTRTELDQARTHDPYWNAAQKEMVITGYMHNYMRMYWGKKILEWSNTPSYAFQTALALNNKYFLDGRDPNSYANVAWIFGLHDRPFQERPVYGKVRPMTARGLERKCDIRAYVEKVEQLGS